jgi:hypothetical protein
MGHLHLTSGKPCQDYARSVILDDSAAFAVVSDGCSGGGETDNGSRILSHSAVQAMRVFSSAAGLTPETAHEVAWEQWVMASDVRDRLGLSIDDMLATSVHAYYTPDGGFAHVLGDGALAFVQADGTLMAVRYEWMHEDPTKVAPMYPAYQHDNFESFIEHYGGNLAAAALRQETWRLSGDEDEQINVTDFTLAEGIRGPIFPLPPDLQFVAVFTDGVSQVEDVPWQSAVKQLLAFKTLCGDFAKRRMIRFVKDAKRTTRGPIDDLAFAVICNKEVNDE